MLLCFLCQGGGIYDYVLCAVCLVRACDCRVRGLLFVVVVLLYLFPLGGFMAFRSGMSRRKSRKSFSRGAQRVHPKNLRGGSPMRGGIRL